VEVEQFMADVFVPAPATQLNPVTVIKVEQTYAVEINDLLVIFSVD